MKRIINILLFAVAVLFAIQARAAYDPTTQRWIQRDPIGEMGGINLYQPMVNNPVNFVDPYGLDVPSMGSVLPYVNPSIWNSSQYQSGAQAGDAAMNVATAGLVAGTTTSAAIGLVAPEALPAWLTALGAGAGGGYVGNGVQNSLTGQPFNQNAGTATTIGAGFGLAGFGVGKLCPAKPVAPQTPVANPVPPTLARAVPNGINPTTLGPPGAPDVFVTDASQLQGLTAQEIANVLSIPESPTGFQVFEFPTPENGLASPVFRTDPGFVGGGQTAGGASEFVVPNGPIPSGATSIIVH